MLFMLLFIFISLLSFFCCSCPPLPQLHTHNSKHIHKDQNKKTKPKEQRDDQKPQIKTPKNNYEREKGGEKGMKGKAGDRG